MIRALGVAALLQILTGDSSGATAAISEIGASLLHLAYSRKSETEADATAVSMLNDADLNAGGLAKFLRRLHEETPTELPTFLSTHPSSLARSELAMRRANTSSESSMSPREWTLVRMMCSEPVR